MAIDKDITDWAKTRPEWQRVVLHGLCNGDQFDSQRIEELAEMVVSASTPREKAKDPDLSLLRTPTNDRVSLVSVGELKGVNALMADQTISMGENGLTVIYGDNASGKTGYSRVIEAVAGARVSEDILDDVFAAPGASASTAKVSFRRENSKPETSEWPDSVATELQQIHFFDKHCGHAYLTTTSEITYRPSPLQLLDDLVRICDAVRGALERKSQALNTTKRSLPTLDPTTAGGRFISSLSASTTKEQIDSACKAPADAAAKLSHHLAEESRLAASNPNKERDRLDAAAARMNQLAGYCEELVRQVSTPALKEHVSKREKASQLRRAAQIAAQKNSADEPISGVGSETWRALWEAARNYSTAEAYHEHEFPVVDGDARCVLCQQTLEQSAAERLKRFHLFMTDTTETEARSAEQVLHDLVMTLKITRTQRGWLPEAIAAARSHKEELGVEVGEWIKRALTTLDEMVKWSEKPDTETPSSVDGDPTEKLRAAVTVLQTQASQLDQQSFDRQLAELRSTRLELQSAIALSEHKSDVEHEVGRLKQAKKLEKAEQSTDTGVITRKSSELTREYATKIVRDQFTRESERLKLRRITLDDQGGVKGRLKHQPTLLGASRRVPVTKVLSEGEQTALGLAGFFTEAFFDESKSTIVLDDPVTSLDHERRGLVAKRLVEFAQERQVVVFTHEITFVGDLLKQAELLDVPVTPRSVQRVGGDKPGRAVENHPWKVRDIKSKIHHLREGLARIKKNRASLTQDEYEKEVGGWAGDFSETWERAVHVDIVNEVVDRGTSEVRPKKFRILASITAEDDAEFQDSYGKCSLWARRHDKAPEINYVPPEPDELERELDRFEAWYSRIVKYRS